MRKLLLLFIAIVTALPAYAQDDADTPVTLQPVDHVVELFTSQSCSSCPPADELLTDFVKARNLLVVSHHVDYWNHLQWQDTFSSPAATARQQAYAAQLGSKVFTPQMVVDGQDQFVGSHEDEALAALARPPLPNSLAMQLDGQALRLNFPVPANTTVWLVTYRRGTVSTDIKTGENAGRKLPTTNPMMSMNPLLATPVAGVFAVPEEMLQAVAAPSTPPIGYAIIVQQGDAGIILAAAKLTR